MIKKIILTAEKLADKPVDYEDMNTDVIVDFEDGEQYVATFFSYKNLKKMLEADLKAESKLHEYYLIVNLVLVENFNNGNLFPVVESMIAEGDFQLAFRKLWAFSAKPLNLIVIKLAEPCILRKRVAKPKDSDHDNA